MYNQTRTFSINLCYVDIRAPILPIVFPRLCLSANLVRTRPDIYARIVCNVTRASYEGRLR